MNLVLTVPIFLKDLSPAVMNDWPRFFKTVFPLRSMDGTPLFLHHSYMSSSNAPTNSGESPSSFADSTQFCTKSVTLAVPNVTKSSSPGPTCDSSVGLFSSLASSSLSMTFLSTAWTFSLHMSRIHFGWSVLDGSTSCRLVTEPSTTGGGSTSNRYSPRSSTSSTDARFGTGGLRRTAVVVVTRVGGGGGALGGSAFSSKSSPKFTVGSCVFATPAPFECEGVAVPCADGTSRGM